MRCFSRRGIRFFKRAQRGCDVASPCALFLVPKQRQRNRRRTFAGSPVHCARQRAPAVYGLAMLASSPRVHGCGRCAWHALYPAPLTCPSPAVGTLRFLPPACLLPKAGRQKMCGAWACTVPIRESSFPLSGGISWQARSAKRCDEQQVEVPPKGRTSHLLLMPPLGSTPRTLRAPKASPVDDQISKFAGGERSGPPLLKPSIPARNRGFFFAYFGIEHTDPVSFRPVWAGRFHQRPKDGLHASGTWIVVLGALTASRPQPPALKCSCCAHAPRRGCAFPHFHGLVFADVM